MRIVRVFDRRRYAAGRLGKSTVFLIAAVGLAMASMAGAQPSAGQALADAPDIDSASMTTLCAKGPERKANWGRAAADQMIRQGWGMIGTGEAAAASALKLFWAALNTGPERPDAYWGLAIAGHIAGRDAAAVDACFAKTQALLPGDAGAFADHGRVLEGRGAPKAAIEKFERALSIDPNLVDAHVGMARALFALGDETAAARHVERVEALTGRD